MAKHKLEITELNQEQSVGNLRQMVLALAGLPDDAFYIAHTTPAGRVRSIEGRWDDQGVPVDPQTLPMRAVRIEMGQQ
jgi:hypothetical protein